MEHPEISVIVPVYNGSRHIRRCIDSVFANDFDKLEIILIDDGSTDDSLDILKVYEEKNPRQIRVYSHENMGVALTRNRGIELAEGKYILFLDQDDWFDQDYILTFYSAIEKSGSDVVIGGYKRPDADGNIILKRLLPGRGYYRFITVTAWGKIHRTAFLTDNEIRFFDNNIGEDVAFCMQEANLSDRFSFIPYIGYNWFLNEESVSETEYKGFRESVALFTFLDKLESFDWADKRVEEYVVLKSAFYYLMHSGRASSPEKYEEVYKEIMGRVKTMYPRFTKNRYLNFGFPGETIKVKVAVSLLTMIHRMGIIPLFASRYCKGTEAMDSTGTEAED